MAHYEFNLRRMIAIAGQAQVPLMLMNPACHLRDSPPFKAEHRPGLTTEERERLEWLWQEARDHYADHPWQAVRLLQQSLAIDDRHAGIHYDLAKCYDALGQFPAARREYLLAKEFDVCPLRMLQPMHEILLKVAGDTDTPVIDVWGLFERLSRHGIPGNDWFVDHVHPSIAGYQQVADEIADVLIRHSMVRPQPGWQARKEQAYQRHLDSLPMMYFLRAEERLHALRIWASGRVHRERPAARPT